jgi:hypothetical protein
MKAPRGISFIETAADLGNLGVLSAAALFLAVF